MTKEELKKEAIKYAVDYPTNYGKGYKHKDLRIAYLAGAEPREKRIAELIALINAERKRQEECDDVHLRKIAELEKENAELKADNDAIKFAMAMSEKVEKQLREENAEYKEVFGSCDTCKRSCDIGNCCDPRTKSSYLLDKVKVIAERQKLLKENAELKEELKKWKDEWQEQVQKVTDEGYARTLQTIQLTKAKELLKRYVPYRQITDSKAYKDLAEETEQFISEVEK